MLKVIASHILISDDLETRKVWCTQYAVQFNFIKISLVCDSIELFLFKGKCFTMVDEDRKRKIVVSTVDTATSRERNTVILYGTRLPRLFHFCRQLSDLIQPTQSAVYFVVTVCISHDRNLTCITKWTGLFLIW